MIGAADADTGVGAEEVKIGKGTVDATVIGVPTEKGEDTPGAC